MIPQSIKEYKTFSVNMEQIRVRKYICRSKGSVIWLCPFIIDSWGNQLFSFSTIKKAKQLYNHYQKNSYVHFKCDSFYILKNNI